MNTVARQTETFDGSDSPTKFFTSGHPARGLTRFTLLRRLLRSNGRRTLEGRGK